jgi:ATP-dependent DNA helicase RecQ
VPLVNAGDHDLFDKLRALRRTLAQQRGVPPYVIFPDATLREFAAVRPKNLTEMRQLHGVGDVKLAQFGEQFLAAIATR